MRTVFACVPRTMPASIPPMPSETWPSTMSARSVTVVDPTLATSYTAGPHLVLVEHWPSSWRMGGWYPVGEAASICRRAMTPIADLTPGAPASPGTPTLAGSRSSLNVKTSALPSSSFGVAGVKSPRTGRATRRGPMPSSAAVAATEATVVEAEPAMTRRPDAELAAL